MNKLIYIPSIRELIDRPEITPGGCHKWAAKMTFEEFKLWEETTRKKLIEDGVSEKFPDMNSAMLAKEIDREILYDLMEIQINADLFNKTRNGKEGEKN